MKRAMRPIIGTSTVVAAAVVAIAIALTSAPSHAAAPAHRATTVSTTRTAKLSPAESASLHRLVSTKRGRQEFYQAFENSYGRIAHVGTGPLVKPGTTQLDLAWGLSGSGGEHFWIIASYADILGGALGRAVPYCTAALAAAIDPFAAAAVCIGVETAIYKIASGQPRLSNHGVWAEVHFWPFWTGAYRW
jgi:hypothetical protein